MGWFHLSNSPDSFCLEYPLNIFEKASEAAPYSNALALPPAMPPRSPCILDIGGSSSRHPPDFFLSPVLFEPHLLWRDHWMRFHQTNESPMPGGTRGDNAYEIGQQSHCVAKPTILHRVERICQFCRFFPRNLHFQGKRSIPDSPMMSTEVADDGQMMGKRYQDFFIQFVDIGDTLSVCRIFKILQPERNVPKGHQLAGNPDGRKF